MKKIISIVILLFSIHSVIGQTYVPFPTSNASWRVSYECTIHFISISGDSIINGQTYHKLIAHKKEFHRDPNYECYPFSSYTMHYNIYFGAFRNDSANKQVLFIPPNKTSDTVLYDFNLSLGDTIQNKYRYNPSSNLPNLYVVRIDSVYLGNKWRKRFTLNSCFGATPVPFHLDSIRLIEGIGSTQGLLDSLDHCPYFGSNSTLVCAKENGVTTYPDSTTSCQIVTALKNEQKKKQKLNIVPNPTQGQVTIPQNMDLVGIQLYSIKGQLLEEIQVSQSTETTLSIEGPSGMYLLRMQMRDGSVESAKIIKQ